MGQNSTNTVRSFDTVAVHETRECSIVLSVEFQTPIYKWTGEAIQSEAIRHKGALQLQND